MRYIIEKDHRPVYLHLYRQLRDDILRGVFPYGSRLPSKRLLAEETGVSAVTVEHAYDILCDEGYAESRERSGYFVLFRQGDGFAAAAPLARPRPGCSAPPEAGFPLSVLSKTMRRVLTEYHGEIMEKSPNSGHPRLQEALRRYLARNRGIHVSSEQIIIGSGAEYLYRLVVDLLGRDRIYAIENPSYEKIRQIYQAAGAKYRLLPLVRDGIDNQALFKTDADVLHTTPYQSFPSGVTASASRRHEYIRWAGSKKRLIIESDYGSEFSVAAGPMETLFVLSDRDNVIYTNTFSKTISSSMRMGYLVLPRWLVQPFQEKLGFYSCSVPTFEQFVLTELIESGDFERHINRIRRSKRKALTARRE